jgi:quercetin dioxygenase-like cupin family protein
MVKNNRILPAAAAVIVTACILSGSAAATPAEGDIQRTDLANGITNTAISIVTSGENTAFHVQSLVIKPGANSGWHTHAGPEESVITKGTVFVQTAANCDPVAYSAGQTLFLPTGVPHFVANRGPGDAEVIVTYNLPADHPVRDDAPGACP